MYLLRTFAKATYLITNYTTNYTILICEDIAPNYLWTMRNM